MLHNVFFLTEIVSAKTWYFVRSDYRKKKRKGESRINASFAESATLRICDARAIYLQPPKLLKMHENAHDYWVNMVSTHVCVCSEILTWVQLMKWKRIFPKSSLDRKCARFGKISSLVLKLINFCNWFRLFEHWLFFAKKEFLLTRWFKNYI
jgi:hypothetical protein